MLFRLMVEVVLWKFVVQELLLFLPQFFGWEYAAFLLKLSEPYRPSLAVFTFCGYFMFSPILRRFITSPDAFSISCLF